MVKRMLGHASGGAVWRFDNATTKLLISWFHGVMTVVMYDKPSDMLVLKTSELATREAADNYAVDMANLMAEED